MLVPRTFQIQTANGLILAKSLIANSLDDAKHKFACDNGCKDWSEYVRMFRVVSTTFDGNFRIVIN